MSTPVASARAEPVLQRAGKSLPELSIQRHVFAYMLSGALLLFGIISFDRIGVDRFPEIDFPMISIRTVLPGASPEIIDSSIANVIETSVNSVPGIEHIRSTSASTRFRPRSTRSCLACRRRRTRRWWPRLNSARCRSCGWP